MNLIGNADEIHARGPRAPARSRAPTANGGSSMLHIEVDRHRHRHSRRPARPPVQNLLAGRLLHHPPLRRLGLGALHRQALVELMGGEVGVESVVGQGLARSGSPSPLPHPATRRGPSPLGGGKRMLIVDDLAVSRSSLATKLELFSFEPIAVASVDEALAVPRLRCAGRLRAGGRAHAAARGASTCSPHCAPIPATRGCPSCCSPCSAADHGADRARARIPPTPSG